MRLTFTLLAALALTACADDVGEGRVAATVADAPAEPAPAPAADAPAGEIKTLAVDASRSKLGLIGAKVTAQHPIHFNEFTGEITMLGDTLTGVRFVAQTASVESDSERLTGHLKNEDFLHVEQYPTGEFVATGISAGAEGEFTHTVTGNLTIRGVTKQVTFPAKVTVSPTEVAAETEFVINRHDFGVTYPGRADDLVQDNVAMQISFVAPRS